MIATNAKFAEFINSSLPLEKSIFLWLIPFLVPLMPFFPAFSAGGGTWRVELFTGLLLAGFFIYQIRRQPSVEFSINKSELLLIYAPCFGFIIWSGLSAFWADSEKFAVYHTLVWACYLIFYVLARQTISVGGLLAPILKVLGVLIWTVGICCGINYFAAPRDGLDFQGANFSRYSEIFAAIIPIYLILSSTLKNRRLSFLCGATAVIAWFSILCSFNRTCSLLGLFVLIAIGAAGLSGNIRHFRSKPFFVNTVFFVFVIIITQFYFSAASNSPSTLSRFTDKSDPVATQGAAIRPLFVGISFEMFADSPIVGAGAGNFNLKYAEARRSYSVNRFEDQRIGIYEHVLAERTHNEYLQILAELGAVGGILFLWLLGGVGWLFLCRWKRRKQISPLVLAAFLGLSAFLCSSLVSSYSFRAMQNGLIFFFVLALATTKMFPREKTAASKKIFRPRLALSLSYFAVAICLSLTIFSGARAASQFYLAAANNAESLNEAAALYEKALGANDDNAAIYYSYGVRLLLNNRPAEAEPWLKKAIEKGISPSACFSYLASAQSLAGEPEKAEATMLRAVETYPRSIFSRMRYAALLRENGKSELSLEQQQIAHRLNEKQAAGWWLVITEGARRAAEAANRDSNTAQPMNLSPVNALYAILDERRITNPSER